ncbi:MAG TPA: hypothetical protein VMT03_05560 [Polyangia bacterium]|nr:hypothetical protein [Polyangia bacterium]
MARPRLLLLAGLALWWPAVARADKNDLQLLNLCPLNGYGACSWVQRSPTTGQTTVTLDPDAATRYRSLMSELGVVAAPRLMTPADTLGYAGFQVSAELGFTSINPNRQVGGLSYWNGVAGVDPGNPNAYRPPTTLTTIGGFVRKGLWLPVPAMEFGIGAMSILGSHMYAIQGYAKLALQEGFHDWVLPSFAVRGSASQLLGTSDVNMTIYGIDVLVSKAFGLGGTTRWEPFLGWNVLFIDARSAVLDATPTCDAYQQHQTAAGDAAPGSCVAADNGTWNDLGANFTFPSQNVIIRYRWSVGVKVKLSVLFVAAELDYIQHGSTHDSTADAADLSGSQTAGSLSAGFDF